MCVGGTWLQLMCGALPKCLCPPNLTKGQKSEMVGGGQSLVRGVIQDTDGRELSWRGSESEDRCGLTNI